MQYIVLRFARPLLAPYLLACLLLMAADAMAGANVLHEKYKELEHSLTNNSYGIPIHLESNDGKRTMQGDVYGIIHHPFHVVRETLSSPANWCDIVRQHFNIKACTYRPHNGSCKLSFYAGRKYYENPDDVYRLDYHYKLTAPQTDYFSTTLGADTGPLDAKDYRIITKAIPLSDSSTFIHFHYSYRYGVWTRLAMNSYLATVGNKKVGFSVVDTDNNGKPVYVNGIKGIVERNSMRYYFAIKSFLDTKNIQTNKRFEKRISNWFDLTEKYHRQLHEMDKKDYLRYKHMEQKDQLRLQRENILLAQSGQVNMPADTVCRIN